MKCKHALTADDEYGWIRCIDCKMRLMVHNIYACRTKEQLAVLIARSETDRRFTENVDLPSKRIVKR